MSARQRALVLLFGVACASPGASSRSASPSARGPSGGTLVVEVRRLSDSTLVGGRRAQLEQGHLIIVAEAAGPPREAGPVIFTNVAPGRYVLRTFAIAFQAHRDTVDVRPGAIDTIRAYVDFIRCDLDCPEVQLPRRPWWKFWIREDD